MVAAGTTPLANKKAEPTGSLAVALAHASKLLDSRPRLAEQQALEILRAIPGNRDALLILAAAKRRQGDAEAARTLLERLVAAHQFWPEAAYELGLVRVALGDAAGALTALRRATELKPQMSDAWRAIGDLHVLAGDGAAADAAYARQIQSSVTNPVLMEAAAALVDNTLPVAERVLKEFLKRFPTDVAALRMLAEVAARLRRYADAEALLESCLELAPSFTAARHNYAMILYRAGKPAETLRETDRLLQGDPANPNYRSLRAAALGQVGEYRPAMEIYDRLLAEYPDQPEAWMSYGHTLKTAGRPADGVAAYRRSIALLPSFGEAWWSLANLKTFRFTADDIEAMRTQLARTGLDDDDRLHFHFALGKALEDLEDYSGSFTHYAEGNRIRRSQIPYDPDEMSAQIERSCSFFTPERFSDEAGCPALDPIFIVGLPRSGSTLIEQILSSHSAVEGTMELPDITAMARALGGRRRKGEATRYPEILETCGRDRLLALGEEFLERTRVQRKTARPFFIDKMPHNFLHIGMIRLILPRAKIIDARRHPMATCFSNYKQHFARGQAFSYDLNDLGRYYRDYAALMAHFDRVQPGRIHRVIHERLIDDPEGEIRRLLDYCGLPFEESCLRFHENDRAVRTASSEQVRQPISRAGLEQWRNYEPWLAGLKASLGDVLDTYPEAPGFTEMAARPTS